MKKLSLEFELTPKCHSMTSLLYKKTKVPNRTRFVCLFWHICPYKVFPKKSVYCLSSPLTRGSLREGAVPVLFMAPCANPLTVSGKQKILGICWGSKSQNKPLTQFVLSPAIPVFLLSTFSIFMTSILLMKNLGQGRANNFLMITQWISDRADIPGSVLEPGY